MRVIKLAFLVTKADDSLVAAAFDFDFERETSWLWTASAAERPCELENLSFCVGVGVSSMLDG